MTAAPDIDVAIPLVVDLPPQLHRLAEPNDPLAHEVQEAIRLAIDRLLTALGIPGMAQVSAIARPATEGSSIASIGVRVAGMRVRYPDDLPRMVYTYVHERPLSSDATHDRIAGWLAEDAASPDRPRQLRVAEFLARLCVEIVQLQPALLFGDAQGRAYARRLPPPDGSTDATGAPMDVESMSQMLRRVLELRISIADAQAVANIAASGIGSPHPSSVVAEDLIEALRPDVVEIRASRELLRELTTGWEAERETIFPFLRDGVANDLGLEFPPLRFVPDDDLKPRTFAFTINHVPTPPLVGLPPDQCLVNDTPERLRLLDLTGVPVMNPASGQPGSLIALDAEQAAAAAGLTTWNQLQYLVLTLAECLRQYGWCLIHRSGVEQRLQLLKPWHPVLVSAARSRVAIGEISAVLRGLLRERVSVRNLKNILESLLESDGGERRGGDEHPHLPPKLERVRFRLGPQIAQAVSRGTGVIVSYLVEPHIARLTADTAPLGEEAIEGILQGIRAELAWLPPTAQVPSILTFAKSRFVLQAVVRSEFPRLSVLAHEELPPGAVVQPVARIAAKAATAP